MSNTKYVTDLIQTIRKLKNKSMADFAKNENIGEQALRNKLSRANYKVDDLINYAKFLGVDVGFRDGENFYSFLKDDKKST